MGRTTVPARRLHSVTDLAPMVIPLPPPALVPVARLAADDLGVGEPVFGTTDVDGRALRWVAVRRVDGAIAAFVDRCPHWSVSLASAGSAPVDESAIYCSRHGARFRLADGVCDAGPCEGRALVALDVATDAGAVTLSLIRDRLAPGRA